jgi:hypothetical protein
MGWRRRSLLAGLFLLCTSPLLHADLILTLSGTPDTKVVRYEASGSVTLTESLTTGVKNQKEDKGSGQFSWEEDKGSGQFSCMHPPIIGYSPPHGSSGPDRV